ncbi:hypothetical protein PCK1_000981 [Pneumocystis canis]|nr:hypothetical protein PCK1_000981 [Pneumocystis canis]
MNRISSETIFVTTEYENGNSILGVNRKGQVLSVSIDEANIIPYIVENLNDISLALKIASRANLSGTENLYKQHFDTLFLAGKYQEAAKVAAKSPMGILRTPHTIEQFKRVSSEPGQLSPILQYFGILLDKGTLNHCETIELTRLLETNLLNAPQVADAILANEMFSHYNRSKIATLCEKSGLYQRALEHYVHADDIKRVIVHIQSINSEWIINYFQNLNSEISFECFKELLKSNIKQNLQIVLQIVIKYSEKLGPSRIIDLFEQFNTEEGLYYYLGSIVNTTESSDVVFKYIQVACRLGQLKEVERICRENNYLSTDKKEENDNL